MQKKKYQPENSEGKNPALLSKTSSNQMMIQSSRDEIMKHRARIVVTYLVFLILLVSQFAAGCIEQSSGLSGENGTEKLEETESSRDSQTGYLKTEAVNLSGIEGKNASFSKNYRLEALDVELKTPQYDQPLQESTIMNYEEFSKKFLTDETALQRLKENGFVVIANPYNPKEEDIAAMYTQLENEGQLIFITSDTMLHLYHVQFDDSMSQVEQNKLYDLLWELDKGLLDSSVEKYNSAS